MSLKFPEPIKYLLRLLETFRKAIEKKLTSQTVNIIVTIVTIAIIILTSQIVAVLLIMYVLGYPG